MPIDEDRAARPVRIAGHGAGIAPRGLDLAARTAIDRGLDRFRDAEATVRHEPLRVVVAAHHAIAKALRKRLGDAGSERRDEVDPQRTEPRREDRHGDHEAPAKPEGLGHLPHDLRVAPDVRAADVDGAPGGGGSLERGDQVVQHVAHRDRLRLGSDPPRRDHHRKALDEVAHDLERRGARADDHGCAKHRDGHAAATEGLLDLATRGEMLAQPRAGLAEPAEIDDPLHAGHRRGTAERLRDRKVALAVFASRDVHRVDQEVRRVASGHRLAERRLVAGVALDDLDAVARGPWSREHLRAASRQASHAVAAIEQARREPSPDVSGRAGEQDGLRFRGEVAQEPARTRRTASSVETESR